jgi:hypothetical protein
MMVMMVVHFARLQERLYRIGLAGGVQTQFTACANALVRLDVRAGRHFLQVQGYRFIAFDTFERQGTCWFGHGEKNSGKTRILAFHAIPGTGGRSVVLHRPGAMAPRNVMPRQTWDGIRPLHCNKVLYLVPARQLPCSARVEQIPDSRCHCQRKRPAVEQPKQPSKEAVRQWLQKKLQERRPPPDPQQIRRELGWDLVKVDPVDAKRR